jgi:hypothetical protein
MTSAFGRSTRVASCWLSLAMVRKTTTWLPGFTKPATRAGSVNWKLTAMFPLGIGRVCSAASVLPNICVESCWFGKIVVSATCSLIGSTVVIAPSIAVALGTSFCSRSPFSTASVTGVPAGISFFATSTVTGFWSASARSSAFFAYV